MALPGGRRGPGLLARLMTVVRLLCALAVLAVVVAAAVMAAIRGLGGAV